MEGQPKKMYGGIKKSNMNKSSFHSVVDTICTPNSKLNMIAFSSLKGFIFLLSIPPNSKTDFLDIDPDDFTFKQPVYKLVLKVCVLCSHFKKLPELNIPDLFKFEIEKDLNTNKPILDPVTGFPKRKLKLKLKETEFESAFILESKRQQFVYLSTLVPNGLPICPSVCDVSIFDTTQGSLELLTKMKELAARNEDTTKNVTQKKTIDYLIQTFRTDASLKLGMITMAYAEHSIPLGNLYVIKNRAEEYKYFIEYTSALYFILFIKCGIVPLDFHLWNILCIYKNGVPDIAKLIDFGVTLNADDLLHDAYDEEMGLVMNILKDMSFETLLQQTRNPPLSDEEMELRYLYILHTMMRIDYLYNFHKFKLYRPQAIQVYLFMFGSVAPNVSWDKSALEIIANLTETQRQNFRSRMRNVRQILKRIFSQPQDAFQKNVIDGLVKQNLLLDTNLKNIHHSSFDDHVKTFQPVDNIYLRTGGKKKRKKTKNQVVNKLNVQE
jgi:hypothetical protein